MTTISITTSAEAPASLDVDVVVVASRAGADGPELVSHSSLAHLHEHLAAIGVTGKADEFVRLPALEGSRASVAIVGLGAEVTATTARQAAGSAVRQLAGAESVALAFGLDDESHVHAMIEGASIAAYAFTNYRVKTAVKVKSPVASATVCTSATVSDEAIDRVRLIADHVALVRDLTNRSGGDLYPQAFADAATEAAEGAPVTVEVWDEKKLVAEGCGGIMGIGQGSSRPPRLIKVSYQPEGATTHVALVGKGITYDTGGYSLKPAEAMSGMQNDMSGAAVTLALVLASARLGLPVRMTAWLCMAENLVSSTAIRVNDILTMRGGTTVEVMNTDAEGRLVMADGMVLASEEQPDALIDVATLTGAAIVSLGRRTVGVMGDADLVGEIVAAGEQTGEPHWHMPLPAELRAQLDSRFADMANLKPGNRDGGMLVAGTFLKEFVGKGADGNPIPWAHLDIAGAAVNEGPAYGYLAEGATGVSLRTLLAAVEKRFAA
ncbi:MAG: leucyl aminopeptidase [Microcella sp.]|uniref:leucyl aminopeptidase n=1 Tax=Microcella sp. TaxID=1913979 RepID=UPI0024CBC18F|nr:leucyl aminopeptidase [Microcella sp.]UYN82724.1 MAG: leucyl aminopeptidase [Microcella sp.]